MVCETQPKQNWKVHIFLLHKLTTLLMRSFSCLKAEKKTIFSTVHFADVVAVAAVVLGFVAASSSVFRRAVP